MKNKHCSQHKKYLNKNYINNEAFPKFITAFIISIVPLIVYLKVIDLKGDLFKYWTGANVNLDFFSYYKMIIFVICSTFLLIYFLYTIIIKKYSIIKTNFYIPLIIYGITIILSTILSTHKEISIYGFVERYEGMIVLLLYLADTFIIINTIKSKKSIKTILFSLIISSVFISVIGLSQFIGKDFFQSNLGKSIILPDEFQQYANNLKFNFGKGLIYGTLYNPDYIGSYMGMIIGLTFTLCLCLKNAKYKIINFIIFFISFINIIGSGSRAGVLGVILSLTIGVIFMRKELKKNILLCLAPLILVIVISILNISTYKILINKFQTVFSQIAQTSNINDYQMQSIGSGRGYIWYNSIKLLKNTFFIGYGPDTFATVFPRSDSSRKILRGVLIDKPHNMYLQIAINTGIISLICVFCLFILYIVSSFKLYIKASFDNLYNILGLAIFVAFLSYIITAVFNDSVISVAPVFWVLLGIGISINLTIKSKVDE